MHMHGYRMQPFDTCRATFQLRVRRPNDSQGRQQAGLADAPIGCISPRLGTHIVVRLRPEGHIEVVPRQAVVLVWAAHLSLAFFGTGPGRCRGDVALLA